MSYKRRDRRPIIATSKVDWARLAAFIDGEGSILITERQFRASSGMYLRLVIANTDPRLPRWCRELFGGVFIVADRRRSENHRVAYKWHVSSKQASDVLLGCLPYLILKKDQAEVALKFQDTVVHGRGRGVRVSDADRAIRVWCKEELHRLRWRSLPADDIDVAEKIQPKGAPKLKLVG